MRLDSYNSFILDKKLNATLESSIQAMLTQALARANISTSSHQGDNPNSGNDDNNAAKTAGGKKVGTERVKCNCKKSRCLKLYCECFAAGEFCIDCGCEGCANVPANEEERKAAINVTRERNPFAFKPKVVITILIVVISNLFHFARQMNLSVLRKQIKINITPRDVTAANRAV